MLLLLFTLSLAPGDVGEASVCDVNKPFFVLNESTDVSEDDDRDEAVLGQRLRLPVFGWISWK